MLNLTVRAPLAVALGAIAGALCRYYIGRWVTLSSFVGSPADTFPLGTLVVNLSGCLLMGIAAALGSRLALSSEARLLVITGGLGAYTTFSTYSLETVDLLLRGRWEMASVYWMGSAVLGLVALRVGMLLGSWGSGAGG